MEPCPGQRTHTVSPGKPLPEPRALENILPGSINKRLKGFLTPRVSALSHVNEGTLLQASNYLRADFTILSDLVLQKYRQYMAGLLAPPYGVMETSSNNDSK